MQILAYFVLTAAVAGGCADTAASTFPDDASIGPDGGNLFPDGGVDAGVDSGVDAGMDAGMDGGVDAGVDGGGSWCDTSVLCPGCPNVDALCDFENPCPVGEVCHLTGCGDLSRCFVTGGGACENDDDCGNPAYACNQAIYRCLRIVSGCDDSNDCVAGFACEDGTCVDRRVPCESGVDCPHGYRCSLLAIDQRFCRRITRPCDNDVDCFTLGAYCGNPDGDTVRECMPSRMPNVPNPVACDNAQCATRDEPVCESSIEGTVAVCGKFGPCASADDCALGFECQDLWGDGRKECVLPSGTCIDSSVCAPREVCASPRTDGPPACIAGATM